MIEGIAVHFTALPVHSERSFSDGSCDTGALEDLHIGDAALNTHSRSRGRQGMSGAYERLPMTGRS